MSDQSLIAALEIAVNRITELEAENERLKRAIEISQREQKPIPSCFQ